MAGIKPVPACRIVTALLPPAKKCTFGHSQPTHEGDTMDGATLWKVIGLALTATLGVIGTVTDTKENTGNGYKVRPIGWVVAAGILIASLVGGIAQHIDDAAADAEQATQLAQLAYIAEVSERNLNRFSGQLRIEGYGVLSLQQTPVKVAIGRYQAAYRKYEAALNRGDKAAAALKPSEEMARAAILDILRTIHLTLRLPGDLKRSELYAEVFGADLQWNLGHQDIGADSSLTVALSGVPHRINNDGIRSVVDFADRRLELVTNVDAYLFDMNNNNIYFIDDATHSPITSAKLIRRDVRPSGAGYDGRTKNEQK
jgi:hypothetical protein